MLGKLFKHEMKAMARLLLPLLLVLAALTAIDRIVLYLDIFTGTLKIIPFFITFAYGCSVAAVLVITVILSVFRFYKNLIAEEGYLMFTLPVKSHQLITSKLIASALWTFIGYIAAICSVLVVLSGYYSIPEIMDMLATVISEITAAFQSAGTLFAIELLALIILGTLNNILVIYVSIAIGQLFNGHKILGAVGAYIGINIVLQTVLSVGVLIIGVLYGDSFDQIDSITHILLPYAILAIIILDAAYYTATDYIFKRKLNLE